jgi:hypothetical protein
MTSFQFGSIGLESFHTEDCAFSKQLREDEMPFKPLADVVLWSRRFGGGSPLSKESKDAKRRFTVS